MEEEFDNTFSVEPMSQAIMLVPGQVYEGKITVINTANSLKDFPYKVEVTPYNVIGQNYAADLLSESDRTAITKWMKIAEPTGVLEPNETREVSYTITVPSNVPAGGQYAAITVSSNDQSKKDEPVSVKNVFEIASVLYAEVAGETVREGEVLENNVPGFVMTTPITISSLLSNRGNVHEKATYSIAAVNVLNGQTIYPVNEVDGSFGEMIMPETTRSLEREIGNLPSIGLVRISQSIEYLGQTSVNERTVIICPIWLIVLVIAMIVAVVTGLIVMVRKRRAKIARAMV